MVLMMMSLEVVGPHVCCYAEEKEKTRIVRLLDTGFPRQKSARWLLLKLKVMQLILDSTRLRTKLKRLPTSSGASDFLVHLY